MASDQDQLRAAVLAFEDFLNEPRQLPYPEPMDVRDFRHAAYREWEKLSQRLLSLLSPELGGWRGIESYRPGVDPARVLIAREYKLAVMVSNYDSDREGLADDEPPYGFGWKDITHWMPLPPPPTGAR